jgi:glycosyltransferase involved in cell wall biosynthesis
MLHLHREVTAIVITYNAERTLQNCLDSLKDFKEIIVIDNNSADKSIKIATKYTKNIFKFKDKGLMEIRNFAIQSAKLDWVLFLDADEILNEKNLIKLEEHFTARSTYKGFWLQRRNYYGEGENDYLKYGLFYPDYQLRLFMRKFKYHYDIHEVPNIPTKDTKHLNDVEIYHFPNKRKYFSLTGISKFNNFIHIYSKALISKNIFRLIVTGIWSFIDLFFISLIRGKGILDGYYGIIAAFNFALQISFIHFYAIYRKLFK